MRFDRESGFSTPTGALAGSVSVYDVGPVGSLNAIDGSPFADNQTAPCWVAISPDGSAPLRGQHSVRLCSPLRGRGRRQP